MSTSGAKVMGGGSGGGDVMHRAEDDDINVDTMIVKELRVELMKRGLSTAGRKAGMQLRLKEYISNAAKVKETSISAASQMKQDDIETKKSPPEMMTMVSEPPAAVVAERKRPPAEEENGSNASVIDTNAKKKGDEKQEDWRIQAEERRKAALAIRARKKLKTAADNEDTKKAVVTPGPVANPYTSPNKKVVNPYAKKSSVPASASTSAVQKSPANVTGWMSAVATTESKSPGAVTIQAKSPAVQKPKVVKKPSEDLPRVTSNWGDCRFDLWEELCTCGGERKAPDTRMCRCLAVFNAGLGCECNRGVLLIKSGPRGYFLGCSKYRKEGCKLTKRYGPPNDGEASRQLAQLKYRSMQREQRERAEWARIADPFEREWRAQCRCDGAKELNTFECFMRSEGGCGMLPLCPNHCGGALFLHQSRYGKGKWWGCSNYKNGSCKFKKDYVEHY